ncbi:MAG: prolyl oligopeptidase family serine peptidase [Anaerolineales bacterium]|jgi:prolyl oligopeptidase
MQPLSYPETKKIEQIDDIHGILVSDPYRWLEDSNSRDTQVWIEKQNELTQAYLSDVENKEFIRKRLTDLWDFPRAYAPLNVNGKYFQLRNNGLQNQNVLVMMDSLDGERTLLLDPNEFSEDGTIALVRWKISRDGKYLAYATSTGGSDWQTWRVREILTLQDLPDTIEWSKFSNVVWHPENSGFYYCAYDQPEPDETYEGVNKSQKIMFHKLGSEQNLDQLIFQRPDKPEWSFEPLISDDGVYLILHVWKGTDVRNRLFYRELSSDGAFIELIPDLEATYQFIGNDGPRFYFKTNYQSSKSSLIRIDIHKPKKKDWQTIIPEDQDAIESIKLVFDQFIIIYLHDAYHRIKRFDKSGAFLGEIPLPMIGSIFSFDRETFLFGEHDADEMFFVFNSFIYPPTVTQFNFIEEKTVEIERPHIAFNFSNYHVEQKFSLSKDGTRVPMFLVRDKRILKNPDNPALLYGYGGFNISITPEFLVSRIVWLELGGTLAIANLRGGGEYGEQWHADGSGVKKQNVFDDMIACAEYLIENNYTSKEKLAIEGRSNGGLLVGACITQRPDLFGAALPAVGVMDMLRFHKFTIGWAWVSDYGSPDDPDHFKVLYSYSPLHNIKQGMHYPATLVTTADHDDRVVPSHSFKFISTLQAAQGGDAPVLIRIQTKAGHGFGKPTQVLIDERTDIISFLIKSLNISSPPIID